MLSKVSVPKLARAIDLVGEAQSGSRLALARLLTCVENEEESMPQALSVLFPFTGRAHRIGVTGSPGTGKSSLVTKLALVFRKAGKTAAILAVDPSSPFTGGAILGDRIRMRELAGDAGIFIRSMSSRGALGGLARTTSTAADVLDAAGFEVILIETVGVGQAEIEIASLAHSVVVVEAPGLGDEIQAIKAGILEIADFLIVNKSDLPGALRTESALLSAFHGAERTAFRHHSDVLPEGLDPETNQKAGWQIPILRTNAISGEGVPELAAALNQHRQYLIASGTWQRKEQERIKNDFDQLMQAQLFTRWKEAVGEAAYAELIDMLATRSVSPQAAVAERTKHLFGKKSPD